MNTQENAGATTEAPAITTPDFSGEIPHELAKRAHDGTSFSPEVRAGQEIGAWAGLMGEKFAKFAKLADTPEKSASFSGLWTKFHAGALRRRLDHLRSRSRCLSAMITGPANFPTKRNRKSYEAADRRAKEFSDYLERWETVFEKVLCPKARPIMSGDADAVDRLREEIEDAESHHELMVETNAAIRKHAKAGQAAQLEALRTLGHSEATCAKLLTPDCMNSTGYYLASVTNSGARIRMMKKRLAHLETVKAQPVVTLEREHARIEDNPPENRVRLFFPGKPDAATIADLKRSGFRWTPSLGCWQAYRNRSSQVAALKLAGPAKTEDAANAE